MKLRNLTPHKICLYRVQDTVLGTDDNQYHPNTGARPFFTLPSEGHARAGQGEDMVSTIDIQGTPVPVWAKTYGEPIGLPDPEPGTLLIVSTLTAQAAKRAGRTTEDLLVPAHPVRDKEGRIVGCQGFARI